MDVQIKVVADTKFGINDRDAGASISFFKYFNVGLNVEINTVLINFHGSYEFGYQCNASLRYRS